MKSSLITETCKVILILSILSYSGVNANEDIKTDGNIEEYTNLVGSPNCIVDGYMEY